MNHSEALQQMAAERYLLDELKPEEREAFEEHFFECPDCALDLRAGVAFVDEAKDQLPALVANLPASVAAPVPVPASTAKVNRWFSWGLPSFAVPAFAALLLVLGYQNLVTLPALRTAASEPRLLPWAAPHGQTRGANLKLQATRTGGVVLPIDLSMLSGTAAYPSYALRLTDAQGKQVWSGKAPAPVDTDSATQRLSLVIPGSGLRDGVSTLEIFGISAQGQQFPVDRYSVEIHLTGE